MSLICLVKGHDIRLLGVDDSGSKGWCVRCLKHWDHTRQSSEPYNVEMQLVECMEFLTWLKGHDHWLVQIRLRELCRKLKAIGEA